MRPLLAAASCRIQLRPRSDILPCAEVIFPPKRTIRPGFQRRLRSNDTNSDQKVPLDGYYADILSNRTRSTSDDKISSDTKAQPERKEVEARARVVFGSRLAGPERRRQLEAGSQMIAGIKVPPRPEEPDNCCMSGCVNCVWDRYRDELEEWAAANALAQARLAAQAQGGKGEEARGEVMGGMAQGAPPTHVAVSMDDDGGGSETNWNGGGVEVGVGKGRAKEEDIFGNIPVGIREFMRTEKMLKERHARESSLGG